jgi:hypothetical protein
MTSEIKISDDSDCIRVLLAGPDTLYFSCDIAISDTMRARLDAEKATAQFKASSDRSVHCPDWLGARICPQGARGGYAFLIETEDFSIKLLGERIQHRPGVYIELRSHALHAHTGGLQGACEAALAWVREKLFADQVETLTSDAISFASAKLSRADIHVDWQGGYAPTPSGASDELRRYIRPGKTKWAFHGQGHHPTGYAFGRGHIQARIYNKTHETVERSNDAYAALLTAREGEASISGRMCGAWSSSCAAKEPRASNSMRHPKKMTTRRRSRRNWLRKSSNTPGPCHASSPGWRSRSSCI